MNSPASSSGGGDFLEKIVHLRTKNALWRSWSIEGISEAIEDDAEGLGSVGGKRSSLKRQIQKQKIKQSAPPPKAWELFYERFLRNIGDSSLALELSRRQHGSRDAAGDSGTTGGNGNTANAPPPPPAAAVSSEGVAEADGAVRGGQLFRHLASGGRVGSASGGAGLGEDSDSHFLALSRGDSGGSELAFGIETYGSDDQHPHRRRLRSSSVGSVENSPTPLWTNDIDGISPRLSESILGERLGNIGAAADQANFLRKTFTHARNQRLRHVPDDTASAFLGDDLSVHHNNYFGSFWSARSGSGSAASSGGGAGGFAGSWRTGAFDASGEGESAGGNRVHFVAGAQGQRPGGVGQSESLHRGGSSPTHSKFGRSRNVFSHGDLRGVEATDQEVVEEEGEEEDKTVSMSMEGSRISARNVGWKDSTGTFSAPVASSGGLGKAEDPAATALPAAADSEDDFSIESMEAVTFDDDEWGGDTGAVGAGAAAPTSAGGAGDGSDNSGIIDTSRFIHGALGQLEEHPTQGSGRKRASARFTPSGPALVGGMASGGRPEAAAERGGVRIGGMSAKSMSALDKLVQEEDRGQAVMMPLMDWNDWVPDRLHWTYPAVVHAFPRCLYVSDDARVPRSRQGDRGGNRAPRSLGGLPADSAVASPAPAAAAGAAAPAVEAKSGMQERQVLRIEEVNGEAGAEEAETAGFEAAAFSPPQPSPFEPISLGEVYIRTAPASDLAPSGLGAGPWRRRWLVLRQTYLFELLEPPPASIRFLGPNNRRPDGVGPVPAPAPLFAPSDSASGAAVSGSRSEAGQPGVAPGRDGDQENGGGGDGSGRGGGGGGGGYADAESGNRRKVRKIKRSSAGEEDAEQQQRPRQPSVDGRCRGNDASSRFVAPVGFVCLSKASVGVGGINWGPKTLLIRCQARPPLTPHASGGGGDGSVRAGRHGSDIGVELRMPSTEAAEQWTALFRDRAALEMSSLFEPSPSDSEVCLDNEDGDSDGDRSLVTHAGFPVLGTGPISRVLSAKRKQPWARTEENVCAIKVMDKQAFWSRVRSGAERVDALAREVFCQTTLTIKGADSEPDSGSDSDEGNFSNSDDRSGDRSEERSSAGSPGAKAKAAKERRGGGIVRVHSIFETASELILELDLMSGTDLFGRLVELDGAFTERQAAGIARNMLLAIDKCNMLGFCHRDVKLSNLLYPGPGSSCGPECVVLADFGMATTAGRDGLVRGRCGTAGFVAPEIFKVGKLEGYGMNVDIYSAGVVLYVCLCGYEPFFGIQQEDVVAANKEGVFEFPAAQWDEVSDGAKDLVRKMMEPDPSKRITPRDALRHPWILLHQ